MYLLIVCVVAILIGYQIYHMARGGSAPSLKMIVLTTLCGMSSIMYGLLSL